MDLIEIKINNKDQNEDEDFCQDSCYAKEEWLINELHQVHQTDVNDITPNVKLFVLTDEKQEIPKQKIDLKTAFQEIKNEADQRGNIIFKDKETSQEEMFICDICYRVFRNKYKLENHEYQVHGFKKPLKKKSRRKNIVKEDDWPPNVQKLAKRVNGMKMFTCNFCSYSVHRCDSMTKHITRVHSKGRTVAQYQCEVCGKVFTDKAYLRNHGLSHVTERKHKCEVCGKEFHRQPSLKRHLQTHSTDKQFACLLCDYKSNRKHLMYKHAHHHRIGRSYTCRVCGSEFYTQLAYRSHMYTHNLTPNSCSFCKVGFSSRERMMCHMEKVHFACEIKDIGELTVEPDNIKTECKYE